ncbi:hypothetical protein B1M_42778, partial [Burkholderia sp. TJI49]
MVGRRGRASRGTGVKRLALNAPAAPQPNWPVTCATASRACA